ncbi:MAG TPA: dihydroxyacetone kinase subunit DhaL [Mycobacteriales bacterium]|jgi:dihydroxyacetone kinase phosphoprotein-dependent L subunit|nr:dihydroxyacetone kinase subunit DhaL [Mycobacteriales bacterium]
MAGDLADVEYVVRTMARTAVENEKYFGDLDAVVGDGDFGYSMARGFEVVLSGWDDIDRTDIATFLKKVAITITSKIGGTSGPIWGTAFLRFAATVGDKSEVDGDTLVAGLRAAAEGIMARGKAELGDKTLLDSLVPATDALEQALAAGEDGAAAFATKARETAEATKELQARRGRASYTGERSIGSVDAGAIAVAVLAEAVSAGWANRRA